MAAPRPPARARTRRLTSLAMTATVAAFAIALLPALRIGGSAAVAAVAAANPFAGQRLFVNPSSDARRQADAWSRSRAGDAERMRKMAAQPTATWLGDWNRDPRRAIDELLGRSGGAMPVVVVYNIPYRDCGLYSRGGSGGADEYRRWIAELARGIRGRRVAIVLEPDAIAAGDCLPARLRDERQVLVREATEVLKRAGAAVYIDAGHSAWQGARTMADRLQRSGITVADGFALNVSNFQPTASLVAYGDQLSALVGGKHYVLDTSRNGRGTAGRNWCNPPGQALGATPGAATGRPLVDAHLWIKVPGQSDGTCNGGPRAGEWWAEYALGLARTAGY